MYIGRVMLLSSITTIAAAAAAVAIIWFLFRRRENRATVTGNSNSASKSPSSTADSATVYEVFLSFCGKDTRKGFTDFLYTYLVGASIQTFRDDNELRVGEEISSELLKAIKESKISIPIFSKNYASSKWCLLELAQMVECHKNGGHMIYPIFYDINPSDVRNQKGSYEKAFQEHEKKFDEENVKRWREALRMVGGLKGLELKEETNGHEGELVKIVVEKVLLQLKKNYTHVPMNLVGIDKYVERLKGLLEVNSGGVRIVGIHGMGGLGKTTIAKVTYNQLLESFESHCFLENIQEHSKHRDGTVILQNQLISRLQNKESPKFSNVNEGSNIIKDTVRRKKVLIVLDDVDKISQVYMLMGHQSWFGAQSRIIITTRDKSVLDVIEMTCQREGLPDVYRSYEPEFMGDPDSLQLFSKYAFMRDSPMEEYEHHSEEVVSIAAGLPLVLVVLGSTLFVLKGKDLWEAKLRQLRAIPPREILEKLRISFEALEYEQQQIFLDIACYFSGKKVTIPSYMWDDCGFHPRVGISVLVSKSLITIGDDNKLIMHDQLVELGRQIVREEHVLGKQSRFWYGEDGLHALQTNQGTYFVTALYLCKQSEDPDPILASHFRDVPNIRYLDMCHQYLDGDFKHLLSNLRWLHWNCSRKSMPTNLHMENLVVLKLSMSELIQGGEILSQIKVGEKLKVLDLSFCSNLSVLPHLSTFASLEILKITGCKSIRRLDGLEQLKSLKYLNAWGCNHLEALPSLSNLENLVHLNLSYCEKLVEIEGVDKLNSLEHLVLYGCNSLEGNLDISELKKLKRIDARWCEKLTEIKGLHKLIFLEHLDLLGCSFKGVLDMSNLNNLKTLCAAKLEVTNIANSKKLKELSVLYSDKLLEFQGLDELELLSTNGFNVRAMKKFPDLSCLQRLKRLRIRSFSSIEELLCLSNLRKLEEFECNYCEKLVQIQGLDKLEYLKSLKIYSCGSLKRLSVLPNFGMLKNIEVGKCGKLVEVEGLGAIESLKLIQISECPSLKRLDLPKFGVLKEIKVEYCDSLHEIEGLGVIASLKSLSISHCPKLKEIADLRGLQSLKSLSICFNKVLTGIRGLDNLKSLKRLDISECESIKTLPDFSSLEKLTTLDATGCVKLTEISGLEELNSLERLVVHGCKRLGVLPDLPNTIILRDPVYSKWKHWICCRR